MASKRRLRRNACGSKRRYPDQTTAVAAIISFKRGGGKQMSSYKCRWCNAWHIGGDH